MRCAIIGYGYWGKIVEKYIRESKDFELICICSPGLKDAPKIEQLAGEARIEAAIVCTPIDTHFGIVRYLLEHHIHVFCEKPLCKNLAQAKELYAIAEKHQALLFTDYIYTCSPSVNALKDALRTQRAKLGAPVYTDMVIGQFGRFYKTDNVFDVIGVHMLSVIAYIFDTKPGDIKILEAEAFRQHTDMLAQAGTVRFSVGGMTGQLRCSLLSHDKRRRVEVLCEHGLLIFDMMQEYTVQIICHIVENGQYREEVRSQLRYDENNNLQIVLAKFADAVKTMDRSNDLLTMQVTELLEEINHRL